MLRILAAFFVIVNHTNSSIFLSTEPSPVWFASISYFFTSKIAVPVFVMIMGALLLDKEDNLKKYLSRILRIVAATAIFTVIMHLVSGGGLSAKAIINQVLASSHTPYWYLYMYIGLLIILPVMQKMAKAMVCLQRRRSALLLFQRLRIDPKRRCQFEHRRARP